MGVCTRQNVIDHFGMCVGSGFRAQGLGFIVGHHVWGSVSLVCIKNVINHFGRTASIQYLVFGI